MSTMNDRVIDLTTRRRPQFLAPTPPAIDTGLVADWMVYILNDTGIVFDLFTSAPMGTFGQVVRAVATAMAETGEEPPR